MTRQSEISRLFGILSSAESLPPDTEAGIPPAESDQFEVRVLWRSPKPMVSGRRYRIDLAGTPVPGTPERPKYRLDPDSGRRLATKALAEDEIGVTNIAFDAPVAFRSYAADPELGRFTIFDLSTGEFAGVGLIHFALRRATFVPIQPLSVSPDDRSAIKDHAPCVIWFTGLSGAGKSTISNLVEHDLNSCGCHTILLDGDNVRHGLSRDLGFTEAARAENIRRIAEVSRLMTGAGLIVLVSFISPFAAERQNAKDLIGENRFIEVFVDAPLSVAEARDTKGLYARARQGEIRNFTGIDSPYEPPSAPSLHLTTASDTPARCAQQVIDLLEKRRFIT